MNRIKKIALVTLPFLSAIPAFAASDYTSQYASTTPIVGDLVADILKVGLYVVGAVLGVAVVFVAIGFAWRQLKKRVTGKKI